MSGLMSPFALSGVTVGQMTPRIGWQVMSAFSSPQV